MSSVFEEIANLDRPFVKCMLNFGGKLHEFVVRRPNALEADAIEAYYSDEYAKLIVKYTDPTEDGRPNELQQMRNVLGNATTEAVIAQLMGTRKEDVQRYAVSKLDFDPATEAAATLEMTPEEQEAHVAKRREEFKAAHEAATVEVRAEYENLDRADLVETLAQINLNMKCLMEAGQAREAIFVYLTLYSVNAETNEEERVCPSADAVREKFTKTTIRYFYENITAAFALAVRRDLPFVSPDEGTPSGQPTSANTSEPATTQSSPGGRRTRRRRRNSKPSSTPHDGTPLKTD